MVYGIHFLGALFGVKYYYYSKGNSNGGINQQDIIDLFHYLLSAYNTFLLLVSSLLNSLTQYGLLRPVFL